MTDYSPAAIRERFEFCANSGAPLSWEDMGRTLKANEALAAALAHLIEFADRTGQGCSKQAEDARAALALHRGEKQ